MIRYKGDNYCAVIDEHRCVIESLKKGDKEFIAADAKLPLFNISFLNTERDRIFVSASDGSLAEIKQNSDCSRELIYSGFKNADITVCVCISFGKESISWKIHIENRSEYTPEWVDFPQIAVPNDLGRDKNKILWGFNEGVTVDDINLRQSMRFPYIEPSYPSVGVMGMYPAIVETQFMAYYGADGGLYLGCHDINENLKGIDYYPAGGGIKLQFRLFCGAGSGGDFTADYDTVMQFFDGDWTAAADIYRNWFEQNKPIEFKEIESNENIPEWYGESPIVVTYPVRGVHDTDTMNPNKLFPYINAMPHIRRIAKETNSKIMALLMHWEGTAPWAPPYVWPPYGGEAALDEFCRALHGEGHLLGVYCSGIGWTQRSNTDASYGREEQFEKENLADVMCVSPKGELPYSKICTDQRVGYDMCPSCEFTKNVIYDQVKKMADSGIDYIQVLDQNHGGTPYFCYSEKHGHPSVPGKWQVDEMKKLLARLGGALHPNGKNILLGCESAAAEAYLPYLLFNDNRYNLCYEVGTPVPVYAYVYHKYINNFMGNQVCVNYTFDHKKSPESIFYRYAYAFHAGDMLTLVINENGQPAWNWGKQQDSSVPDGKSVTEFVKNCNAWRVGIGKKYLHTGKMCRPNRVVCDSQNKFYLANDKVHIADKLLTSRWISKDGGKGQFIVNYNGYDVECSVTADSGAVLYDSPGSVGTALNPGENRLKIKKLSSVMIENKNYAKDGIL